MSWRRGMSGGAWLLGVLLCVPGINAQEAQPASDRAPTFADFGDWAGVAPAATVFRAAANSAEREEFERRWDDVSRSTATWVSGDRAGYQRLDGAWQQLALEATEAGWRDRWAQAQIRLALLRLRAEGPSIWPSLHPLLGSGLDYWAGSTEVEAARRAYADGVLEAWDLMVGDRPLGAEAPVHAADPIWRGWLENVAKISREPKDALRVHYALARWLSWQPEGAAPERVLASLRRAARFADDSPLGARVLWDLATWLDGTGGMGASRPRESAPDLAGAVAVYGRLLGLSQADPKLRAEAQARAEAIREPTLAVRVDQTFRAESEVFFDVRWRNHQRVRLRMWALDLEKPLPRDPEDFEPEGSPVYEETLSDGNAKPFASMSREIRPPRTFLHGLYLIEALAGDQRETALLLVSDLVCVGQTRADHLLLWFVRAESGSPAGGAKVTFWKYGPGDDVPERQDAVADGNGLVSLSLAKTLSRVDVVAVDGLSPVFLRWRGLDSSDASYPSIVVVSNETPKPGEVVRGIIRSRSEGGGGGGADELTCQVRDQGGAVVWAGTASALATSLWSFEVPLPTRIEAGPLSLEVGDGPALRLATVRVAGPDLVAQLQLPSLDERLQLQPGDSVGLGVELRQIEGPPAGQVPLEVEVRFTSAKDPRFDTSSTIRARTDSRGFAHFRIPMPESSGEGDYRILVRQSPGGPLLAQDRVRLQRTAVHADLTTDRRLLPIGSTFRANLKAQDLYERPVNVAGELRLYRERWREVYVHQRRGSEIGGEEYRQLPDRSLLYTARSDYRLKEQGFVTDLVTTSSLATDQSGLASAELAIEEPGFYRLEWQAQDSRGREVTAETSLYVGGPRQLTGFPAQGLQIVCDPTSDGGATVPILVSADAPGRSMLLVVSSAQTFAAESLLLESASRLVDLRVPAGGAGSISVEAWSLVDLHLVTTQAEVSRASPRGEPTLSVTTDASGYAPGGMVQAEIRLDPAPERAEGWPVILRVRSAGGLPEGESVTVLSPAAPPPPAISSLDERPYFDPAHPEGEPDEAAPPATASGANAAPPSADLRLARTYLWRPDLQLDASGEVRVSFPAPTDGGLWTVEAWVPLPDGTMARGTVRASTRRPLTTMWETPPFLRTGDVLSSPLLITNNAEGPVTLRFHPHVSPEFVAPGEVTVDLPPRSQVPVGLPVRAVAPGNGRLTGQFDRVDLGTLAEQVVTVLDGPRQLGHARAGVLRDDPLVWEFDLPDPLPEGIRLVLNATSDGPTLLAQTLASLWLAEPRGIEDWVTSTVIPVLARQALRDAGFSDREVTSLLESRGDAVGGFSSLDTRLTRALKWLADAQQPDGGWSWADGSPSDPVVTCYVVWYLHRLEAIFPVDQRMLAEAETYLEVNLTDYPDPVSGCWLLFAAASRFAEDERGRPSRLEARAYLDLMRDRQQLSAQGRALLALAADAYGFEEDSRLLLVDLRELAKLSTLADGTPVARWGVGTEGVEASDYPFQSTCLAALAFLAIEPEDPLVGEAINGLLAERETEVWPRRWQTALATQVLEGYVDNLGRSGAGGGLAWFVNDRALPSSFEEPAGGAPGSHEWLRPGRNTVRATPTREGVLIPYAVRIDWPLALPTAAVAGPGLRLERDLDTFVSRPTLLNGLVDVRHRWSPAEPLRVGDPAEVVLRLGTDAPRQHVLITEPLSAAFAADVETRTMTAMEVGPTSGGAESGEARTLAATAIVRDGQLEVYLPSVPAGEWEIRYPVKFQAAGTFAWPPATAREHFKGESGAQSAGLWLEVGSDAQP